MKLKTIGMIGTIAGAVLGVTGFGLMMGGGFATDSYDGENGKVTEGIGAFNTKYSGKDGKERPATSKEYWDFVKDSRKEYSASLKLIKNLSGEEKKLALKELEPTKKIISAADMLIAGAVLFPLFTIVAIGSGVLWFLKRSE